MRIIKLLSEEHIMYDIIEPSALEQTEHQESLRTTGAYSC